MYNIDPDDSVKKNARSACDRIGRDIDDTMSRASVTMQKEITHGTVDGGSTNMGMAFVGPILWLFLFMIRDSDTTGLQSFVTFATTVLVIFIILTSLMVKNYMVNLGTGIVFGIFVGNVFSNFIYGFITFIVTYFLISFIAYYRITRWFGMLISALGNAGILYSMLVYPVEAKDIEVEAGEVHEYLARKIIDIEVAVPLVRRYELKRTASPFGGLYSPIGYPEIDDGVDSEGRYQDYIKYRQRGESYRDYHLRKLNGY